MRQPPAAGNQRDGKAISALIRCATLVPRPAVLAALKTPSQAAKRARNFRRTLGRLRLASQALARGDRTRRIRSGTERYHQSKGPFDVRLASSARSSSRKPFTTRDSVSNTIVARLSGCQAGQGRSEVAGLPVRAKASQALLIRSATRCGSGPLPTMEADFLTLSNTRAISSECGLCHFPPSTGPDDTDILQRMLVAEAAV